jgi:aminoglycoside phosphotransferase (APT) family kinase protein
MIKAIRNILNNIEPKNLGLEEGIKVKSVSRLGAGLMNYSYLCIINNKKYLFRERVGLVSDVNSVNEEYTYLRAVEHLGIGPKPYCKGVSGNHEFIILEYVPGLVLKRFNNNRLLQLARLIARLHLADIPTYLRKPKGSYYKKRLDMAKKKYDGLKSVIDDSIKNVIDKAFLKLENVELKDDKLSICHGDVQRTNIIVIKDGLRIIDWDSASLADPAIEVVETVFLELGLTKKQQSVFVKEYKNRTNDLTLNDRMNVYLPLKYVEGALWNLERIIECKNKGSKLPKHINPRFFAKEMKNYLRKCKKALDE